MVFIDNQLQRQRGEVVLDVGAIMIAGQQVKLAPAALVSKQDATTQQLCQHLTQRGSVSIRHITPEGAGPERIGGGGGHGARMMEELGEQLNPLL
jgi:hypothetical protein